MSLPLPPVRLTATVSLARLIVIPRVSAQPLIVTAAPVTSEPSTAIWNALDASPSMACAALQPECQVGGAVAELDALDAFDPAEIGVDERDGAGEGQRVVAGAAGDAQEGGVGDGEHVVAFAAAQHVGAAVAEQRVVAAAADHDVGGGVAGERLAGGGAGMGDVVHRAADGGGAEDHVAVPGIGTSVRGAVGKGPRRSGRRSRRR